MALRFVFKPLSDPLWRLRVALGPNNCGQPLKERVKAFSHATYKETLQGLLQATELSSLFFEYFKQYIGLLAQVGSACLHAEE